MPLLTRPLTHAQYRHAYAKLARRKPRYCRASRKCYGCAVARDINRGLYSLADTQDGCPDWLLPDVYRPSDSADVLTEWLLTDVHARRLLGY